MPLLWPSGSSPDATLATAKQARPPRAIAMRAEPTPAPAPLVGFVPFAEARRRADIAFTKRYLEELLTTCDWVIAKAAKFACVERSNFKRLMKRAGVSVPTSQPWNGLCPANQHGLDFEGQGCDLCLAAGVGHNKACIQR